MATSFTPCVYPLIPIIVGVMGSSGDKSKLRNLLLSFGYVLGMAITLAALGVVAALTGRLFGQIQSSPIAHLVVGNLFIFFGLALVDVIPLPTFLLNRAGAGKVVKGGSFFSALLMGLVSGFVAAPCTAAVLGALLAYVASTQNVVFGSTLLFTFAMGMGVVLMVIGTFAGIVTSMPKNEKIMKIVQKVFALIMILLGEYFIYKAGILSF